MYLAECVKPVTITFITLTGYKDTGGMNKSHIKKSALITTP